VAHQAKTDSTPSARPDESIDILRRVTNDSVDNMSLVESGSEALVINESLAQDESQILESVPKADVLGEVIESENESLSETRLRTLSQLESASLSALSRQPLRQSVAEAKVIVVATALKSDLARPNRSGDDRESLITFRVTHVLKGQLTDKVITTQMPTDPREFIQKQWIVMLSADYVAGKSRYAGLYNIKLEPEVDAILEGKR